jgi:hypothetical protein
MKIAVMSFWSFHQQPKTLSKRLFEKHIRRYFDYTRDEEKFKFIDNKSIKKRRSVTHETCAVKKTVRKEVLLLFN